MTGKQRGTHAPPALAGPSDPAVASRAAVAARRRRAGVLSDLRHGRLSWRELLALATHERAVGRLRVGDAIAATLHWLEGAGEGRRPNIRARRELEDAGLLDSRTCLSRLGQRQRGVLVALWPTIPYSEHRRRHPGPLQYR